MQAGMKGTVRDIARAAITATNAPLGRRRLARALQGHTGPLHLELGGNDRRSGWLVTNANWRARYYLDASAPWPLEPGSVDLVFADNMIEHLQLEGGRAFLQYCHEALRPGGTLRLATPDVEAAARLYLGENEEHAAAVMDFNRGRGRVSEHQVDILRVPFQDHGHHVGYLYDEASLTAELKRAGFHNIRRCAIGESQIPELRDLENRREGNADSLVQLIMEADA